MPFSKAVKRFLGPKFLPRRLKLLIATGDQAAVWHQMMTAIKEAEVNVRIVDVEPESRPFNMHFRLLKQRNVIQGNGSDLHFSSARGVDFWWEDEWRKVSSSQVRAAVAKKSA